MRLKSIFCPGVLLLILVLLFSLLTLRWLLLQNEDDLVYETMVTFEKMMIREQRKEGYEYVASVLEQQDKGPLNPIWLPFISVVSSGYDRLGYYLRVLQGDPSREATYIEVANFIELAPEAFHVEVKSRYLSDIKSIAGIRHEWLEKHGLNP